LIDASVLTTYVIVVFGLFLIPGPAVVLVLGRATSGRRRVGVATGLGIAAGDLVHTLMAAFGLSAVLMTSALAFSAVKYAGVAYLIYLGLRAFFEKAEAVDLPRARAVDVGQAFRQAILAELLNPKTALFFLAFLPQFVHLSNGPAMTQFALLGFVFVGMSAAYTSLLAIGAGSIGGWLSRHRKVGRWRGKVVGAIYLGLGIRLALQEQ
jgi:threonine/homoserine/homoserine lactone efflux protein